jgi:hypothetical protein
MDREQVKQWRDGWQAFEAFHLQELREASDEIRWRWLNSAIGIAKLFGTEPTREQREAEVEAVRQRWVVLKRNYP